MSSTEVTETVTKLQNLSQERARKVLSLIDDLVELEVLEDVADLKDAREALAEIKAACNETKVPPSGDAQFINTDTGETLPENRPTISYEQLRRESGLDR
jgi:predicted DNA-binding protein